MRALLIGVAVAAAMATGAHATTAIFDFQTPAGANGVSAPYTNNELTITASGFNGGGGTATLFDKTAGGDENGLGLTDDPSLDNEITGTNFVQIDVTGVPGFLTDAYSFTMGSTTSLEEWAVYGSNTAGALGSLLLTGTDEAPASHNLTSGFKYYDFKALGTLCAAGSVDICGSGNVLVHTFTAVTAVPEPATWAMMLLGVAGIGAAMRTARRRESQAAFA